MYCTNCGAEMNDNQAICLKCGFKKNTGYSYCHNCGEAHPEGADVCLHCGVQLKRPSNLNGQDKIAMALIAFFLGGIGIHNFMMGETKKGIVKIVFFFVCGISSILALVDFIRILTDTYVADPEQYF